MPQHGRYSHRYRFDAEPANESVPESDAFYTLNVLLGYSRVASRAPAYIDDVAALYGRCCRAAAAPGAKPYGCGMALWTGARLGLSPSGEVVDRVREMLASRRRLSQLTAQDVGMLASGCTALAVAEGGAWPQAAEALAQHLRSRLYDAESRLFCNSAAGWRRPFASFASQVYPILALYQYGEAVGAEWALRLANAAAARLIALQGGRGEWPWFFFVPGGRVVDFYEMHQHGMAPAFLHHAVAHRVAGARAALTNGFLWLFGDNEMAAPMLRPAERMFYRSQLRPGEAASTWPRTLRSLANSALRRSDAPQRHRGLQLRRECRSYELGWILWSFGGRTDYPELTQRPEFAAAAATL